MNINTYSERHCYQYDVRIRNFNQDLIDANLTADEIKNLRVCDFEFKFVPREDKSECQKIVSFIARHEWLGRMPHRPTHRFIATYKGILAGAVVMATPNTFSNLLGPEKRHLEKLISRGACISWSPKNLASSLIMFAIRWMVQNSEFRFFTAYSDTEARELGTIYQACNFLYLGQTSGARHEYQDPEDPTLPPFSDRLFRKVSFIKRKAIEAGIEWESAWHYGDKVLWDQIPYAKVEQIKSAVKDFQDSCARRPIPPKHKYIYIQGGNKAETKNLKAIFSDLNPKLIDLPYPKIRGPVDDNLVTFSPSPKKVLVRPCRISDQELTERPNPCWPLAAGNEVGRKKYYSIKEVSNMYGLSSWLIYSHIKTDPTFPVVNVGLKKKFLIDLKAFESWLEIKTKKLRQAEHNLMSSDELLEAR